MTHQIYTCHIRPMLVLTTNAFILAEDLGIGPYHLFLLWDCMWRSPNTSHTNPRTHIGHHHDY